MKMVVHLLRADASVVMEVSQDWNIEWDVHDDSMVVMEPSLRNAMADAMVQLAKEMKRDAGIKTINDVMTLDVAEDQPLGWAKNYEA